MAYECDTSMVGMFIGIELKILTASIDAIHVWIICASQIKFRSFYADKHVYCTHTMYDRSQRRSHTQIKSICYNEANLFKV